MDRRRLVLGALLAGVLAFALVSPLTRWAFQKKPPVAPVPARTQVAGQGATAQAPIPAQAPAPPTPAPSLSPEELAQWRQRVAGAWKRDPFFTAEEEQARRSSPVVRTAPAPAGSTTALPSYTIKMVLISETSRVAAIDGRLVTEGEMLGEERVVEIQPDAVVLERAGKRRRVKVAGGNIPLVEVGPGSLGRSDNR